MGSKQSVFRNTGTVWQIGLLLAGTFIIAMAVVQYFDAIGIVVGGVTGLAVLFKNLFDIPMWVVNAVFNLPLFIISYKLFDKYVFAKILLGAGALTVFLGIVPRLPVRTDDLLVDIITGSFLMGAGLGLVFLAQASSGGVDLLSTILNRKLRHISVPKIMAAVDGIIVIAGAGVFGLKKGIYALIGIFIVTKTSDAIVEGPNHAKVLYIISRKEQACADYITEKLERGATYIPITGAYTGQAKRMLMCVVSGREMVKIKQKIYKIDESAICFVGDIREAFGEGFTKFRE